MAILSPLLSPVVSCCLPISSAISNSIIQRFHNHLSLSQNIHSLKQTIEELNGLKGSIKHMVDVAESGGLRRDDQVDVWLKRTASLEAQAGSLMECHDQNLRSCCLHLWLNWKLSQKVAHTLEKVGKHKSEGAEFNKDNVAQNVLPDIVEQMIDTTVVGQALDSALKELNCCFRREEATVVGIYGTGGIGKTTLLKIFNDELISYVHDFQAVIFVVISDKPDIENIQEKIKDRLGLSWDGRENRERRSAKINEALKKKKFLLMLDDVWNEFDEKTLDTIGVPRPHKGNKCKLVLTTRFEAVCNKMGVGDNKIRVNFMAEDEAWELFKMNCGENKFLSNARMENIAKRIAAKCGGLPLALIVIGRALASKTTIEEWKHAESALRDLRTLEIDGMQENLLLSLKYSYDNLHPDDKIKETTQKCFLYCCLFPEDYSISKEQLVEYWVGEGFLDEGFGNDIDRARDKGHSIIGRLKAACLLERGNDQDEVKMHDVIREMARWIANDCTGREHRFLIRTAGQRNINFDVEWSMVERISLINIEFPHLPDTTRQWPNLWTLLLYNSGIERIPSGFFLHMGNLQVLDLSYTRISEIPSGIESLVNLQYLDLSGTNIKLLPKEFGELRRLRQLYLCPMYRNWQRIPKEAISRLSMLEVLHLHWNMFYVNRQPRMNDPESSDDFCLHDLDGMVKLKDLKLCFNCEKFEDQHISFNNLPNNPRELTLISGGNVTTLDLSGMDSLQKFRFGHFDKLEELKLGFNYGSPSPLESLHLFYNSQLKKVDLGDAILPNVCHLEVYDCQKLEITWLHRLPFLEIIDLYGVRNVELLSIHEACVESFTRLKIIILFANDEMERISPCALALPSLEYLQVIRCPKLKKLPLGPGSAPRLKEINGEQEWWDGLEWDDDQTRQIFAGRFKKRY